MQLSLSAAVKLFKRVGITPIVQNTGHPEWVRVFIEFEGCRYGRASFQNGKLYNIKWYGRADNEITTIDRLALSITLMQTKKIEMSDTLWGLLVERAECLQEETYQVKLARRAHLEELDVARGAKKRKKRPAIKKPNVRNFLTLEGV